MRRKRAFALGLILLCAVSFTSMVTYIVTHKTIRRETQVAEAKAEKGGLERFQANREALYARQLTLLNDIIYNPSTDPLTIARAQERSMELQRRQSEEQTLEGLFEARGFGGALVCVGTDGVDVFLRFDGANFVQSAVFLETIQRQTGFSANKVKIIPIK